MRKGARKSARKRTFGGPRVPQGAKMEPKWNQIGPQNVLKIEVSQKNVESGLDPLFTVYTHYRHPPKTSLFDISKQAKCRSVPRAASDTVLGLQSGAYEIKKWQQWNPPGSPREPKDPPMPPKMIQKVIENQHLFPGLPPRVLLGCLRYPNAPKIRDWCPAQGTRHNTNVHLLCCLAL